MRTTTTRSKIQELMRDYIGIPVSGDRLYVVEDLVHALATEPHVAALFAQIVNEARANAGEVG